MPFFQKGGPTFVIDYPEFSNTAPAVVIENDQTANKFEF